MAHDKSTKNWEHLPMWQIKKEGERKDERTGRAIKKRIGDTKTSKGKWRNGRENRQRNK